MLAHLVSRSGLAASLGGLVVTLGAPMQIVDAANAVKLQEPPELTRDGGCTPGNPSQFSAVYERVGVFDDTTWARDRYVEYLVDGANTVLDSRARSVGLGNWERATATLETAHTPQTGPFKIVIYEVADSIPTFARGTQAQFSTLLIRQQIRFNARALDPDCPAAPHP